MRAVDHYTEAEKLLLTVANLNGAEPEQATEYLAAAQVNATLALAGATALQAYTDGSEDELEDWAKAAGEGE